MSIEAETEHDQSHRGKLRRKTLHVRLALVLLALLVLVGGLEVGSTLLTTRLYFQEVQQSLNLDLAERIAMAKHELLMTEEGEVRGDGLAQLFHWLMVVNPGVEFYVLDAEGKILGYDAPPEKIRRDQVALEPVRRFLEGGENLPILGEDPRADAGGRGERGKIFSAAPLPPGAPGEGPIQGYLYIILASEIYDSAAAQMRSSYILRLSAWSVLAALVLATAIGFFAFRRMTAPLRSLAHRMGAFRLGADGDPPVVPPPATGDEVEQLETAFDSMTRTIRTQLAQMQEMEELRRELVANVSHDLRTPVAGLQGYLETLVLKKDQLEPQQREEYLTVALRQGERLARLVEELFELTKLESDEVRLEWETFSLAELVHDNVQMVNLNARQRGVELRAEMAPGLPFVRADLALIERVLDNLIQNALRFTPSGGSVTVRLLERLDRVRVKIADTGVGIADDALPHIFDRFFRSEPPRTGSRGSGLGLAITRRILELHGCEIEVKSEPGQGTVFSFELPTAA